MPARRDFRASIFRKIPHAGPSHEDAYGSTVCVALEFRIGLGLELLRNDCR